ncbi:MAG TPA: 6-phosphogluconolactonase [Candidatus Limnocylindrales bacterium]|jgi:galactosamine-6-phosphate isomerase|nr:6-phosphogluconolactonase [Candidatus Limnocylindrales bacterium]
MPTVILPALRTRVATSYEVMGAEVAQAILSGIKQKPDLLLCVSAGGTPSGAYNCLAAQYARQPRLFKKLRVIQIDEWGGLPRDHAATCQTDLRAKLLSPLQITTDRFVGFRSDASNPEKECRRVAQWLADNGPIDICILGLGLNGHVAMNEPGRAGQPYAHVANLAPSSQGHPMLKSLSRKPAYGLTLGLAEILQSRKIFLLVSGKKKRAPLRRLNNPSVSSRFPASFIWLHPDATLFCDREAANAL